MVSFGIDLSKSAVNVLGESFVSGLPYLILILLVAATSYYQQRQISAPGNDRLADTPMKRQQQMLMKIFPLFFAVISLTLPAGLVVYFLVSNIYRIAQQAYITRSFYRGEHSLGKPGVGGRRRGAGRGQGSKDADKATSAHRQGHRRHLEAGPQPAPRRKGRRRGGRRRQGPPGPERPGDAAADRSPAGAGPEPPEPEEEVEDHDGVGRDDRTNCRGGQRSRPRPVGRRRGRRRVRRGGRAPTGTVRPGAGRGPRTGSGAPDPAPPKVERRERRKRGSDAARRAAPGADPVDAAGEAAGPAPQWWTGPPRRKPPPPDRRGRRAAEPADDTLDAPTAEEPAATVSESTRANGESPKPRRSAASAEPALAGSDEDSSGPDAVAPLAASFLSGLAVAFGVEATTITELDGDELEVRLDGADLGLMIGPRGQTLLAIQDLARTVSQRGIPDHGRLRIDVGGYRERRREALARFTADVARQVLEGGSPRMLEPMAAADRKVVHDTASTIDGVQTRSEGEEPNRRVVILPAE